MQKILTAVLLASVCAALILDHSTAHAQTDASPVDATSEFDLPDDDTIPVPPLDPLHSIELREVPMDAGRSATALAVAASVILVLVELLKRPQMGAIVKRIPKRWRIAVPIVLSAVAGILSNNVAGVPLDEALIVGLFAGPTAVFAHEAVIEALLGQSRSRTHAAPS